MYVLINIPNEENPLVAFQKHNTSTFSNLHHLRSASCNMITNKLMLGAFILSRL